MQIYTVVSEVKMFEEIVNNDDDDDDDGRQVMARAKKRYLNSYDGWLFRRELLVFPIPELPMKLQLALIYSSQKYIIK